MAKSNSQRRLDTVFVCFALATLSHLSVFGFHWSPFRRNRLQQHSSSCLMCPKKGQVVQSRKALLRYASQDSSAFETVKSTKKKPPRAVERYVSAWNRRTIGEACSQFTEDAVLEDTEFLGASVGRHEIRRYFLLYSDAVPEERTLQWVVDDLATSACETKVGMTWHLEDTNGNKGLRRSSFFVLDSNSGLIDKVFQVTEPSIKSGKLSLAVLTAAGKFMEATGIKNIAIPRDEGRRIASSKGRMVEKRKSSSKSSWLDSILGNDKISTTIDENQQTAAERYFSAWNSRDMVSAIATFSEDCEYEDTVFPAPFSGKEALKQHLVACADAFPNTFRFVVDDVASDDDGTLSVIWRIENNGEQLPFTRGCSYYSVDSRTGLITKGLDFVEPSIKLGDFKLVLQSLKSKVIEEPIRVIPLVLWMAYMYIVFLSDGILPGANALQLEQRTWEEVRDLSLNFFLVAPLLHLPFSPVIHPILEGVFNLLLSWAALFAGFLSDDREEKPNSLPMLPIVVGMQFLTSAFFLPYLATRSSEIIPKNGDMVYKEDLDIPARIVGESRALGPLLGIVGAGSIVWSLVGRLPDFGGLTERFPSFIDLLSIDRVGSSFLVDLVIFAMFQGWLVTDDLRRRGVKEQEYKELRSVAMFVPFFGLAVYLALRPPLPSKMIVNDTT